MPDTFYAECDSCGPLPVSGPVSPETTDRDHVFNVADEHVERMGAWTGDAFTPSIHHVIKIWQLVDTWPRPVHANA